MEVAAMIDNELSAELIATLGKIQDSISCWIQQEKDDAASYQQEMCSNYCAALSTVMEDEDSIELCIFLFGTKMNDITLQIFGFNCSGRVRGFDSIIVVYPDKYASTLTLQQRLSSDAIKLLMWEGKRGVQQLTLYAKSLNAAYSESIVKSDALKIEYAKLSDQISDSETT